MERVARDQTYDHLAITPAEEVRLQELNRSGLLDTPPEPEFDNIVRVVTKALDVPIAAITLVDRDRQWFKAAIGVNRPETPRWESFCSHAVALKEALVVPDATLDERFVDNPAVTDDPHVRFYLGVPLKTSSGQALGTLCAVDKVAREPSERDLEVLNSLAALVVEQIELRIAANTDALTGAMGRASFMAAAARDFARVQRSGQPLGLLVVDADSFKAINDTHGHAFGDDVLRHLVLDMASVLRKADYVGRIGGEEFCVALPEASLAEAFEVGERIRTRVAQRTFLATGASSFSVTVSIGVAAAMPGDGSIDDVIDRADRAMYQSKAAGRNRTSTVQRQ